MSVVRHRFLSEILEEKSRQAISARHGDGSSGIENDNGTHRSGPAKLMRPYGIEIRLEEKDVPATSDAVQT